MLNAKTLTLSVLLLSTPALAAPIDIVLRAQQVEALSQQSPRPDDLVFATAMQRGYASAFGGIDDAEHLRREGDADLKHHWKAVESAAFYSDDGTLVAAAQRVFAELDRRGLADARAIKRMFNFLLKARHSDTARAFATAHSDTELPTVPAFVNGPASGLPSVWRFGPEAGKANRIGIDLGPLQIIVVAGCHFSGDAAADIARDPLLGPVFAKHARWLSLPPGNEELDALAEWNRSHPATPMLPIHDREEWALITQWVMPTFAIIKGGKLIDSTKGWRSDDLEFREQLIALLQRTGLLDAGTPQ